MPVRPQEWPCVDNLSTTWIGHNVLEGLSPAFSSSGIIHIWIRVKRTLWNSHVITVIIQRFRLGEAPNPESFLCCSCFFGAVTAASVLCPSAGFRVLVKAYFLYITQKCVQGSTVKMTWWSRIGVWAFHPCWGLSTSVYSSNILYCRMYWKFFLLLLIYAFHTFNIMQLANLDSFYVIVRMTSANICNQQCLCHCLYSWSNMMGSLQLLLRIICSKLLVCLIILVKRKRVLSIHGSSKYMFF